MDIQKPFLKLKRGEKRVIAAQYKDGIGSTDISDLNIKIEVRDEMGRKIDQLKITRISDLEGLYEFDIDASCYPLGDVYFDILYYNEATQLPTQTLMIRILRNQTIRD